MFKVGIDYDCVLFNTTEVWIEIYNEITNSNLTMGDFLFWDVSKTIPEKDIDLFYNILHTKELWDRVRPLEYSVDILNNINKKFDVYIVTATDYRSVDIKVSKLLKYYPFINQKQVITCYNKQLVNVDVLIDDNIDNLLNGSYKKILFDYPWNRNIDDFESDISRVYNWNDIGRLLNIES